ncbi:hypothetical protein KIW84_075154 [Lathyrus oleraceus]|uniref:Uncharacterized protein n=1 Tax=Pisum sativum TaxID=3888 RepID=A0A9D4VUL8_PEA|nr:hypothetical protein KIW84_075154 [Pisum sativum]
MKMWTRLFCAFCPDRAFYLNPYSSNSGILYALLMPAHSDLAWTVVVFVASNALPAIFQTSFHPQANFLGRHETSLSSFPKPHIRHNDPNLDTSLAGFFLVTVYQKQHKLSSLVRTRHSAGECIAVDAYSMGESPWWFHLIWTHALSNIAQWAWPKFGEKDAKQVILNFCCRLNLSATRRHRDIMIHSWPGVAVWTWMAWLVAFRICTALKHQFDVAGTFELSAFT